jgi:hypothetical protein
VRAGTSVAMQVDVEKTVWIAVTGAVCPSQTKPSFAYPGWSVQSDDGSATAHTEALVELGDLLGSADEYAMHRWQLHRPQAGAGTARMRAGNQLLEAVAGAECLVACFGEFE